MIIKRPLDIVKKDLSTFHDVMVYGMSPTKKQLKSKALELLKNEISDLRDSQDSIEESIERLKNFEETGWFYKRAKVSLHDFTRGEIKAIDEPQNDSLVHYLNPWVKIRWYIYGWILVLIIYGLYKLF